MPGKMSGRSKTMTNQTARLAITPADPLAFCFEEPEPTTDIDQIIIEENTVIYEATFSEPGSLFDSYSAD